tara:strand:- start:78 stop:476 length:399 start_codon:yes stop_codon:yes gene_type:complete
MSLNESNDISQLKKFDVDLQFGKQWEVFVDELFSGAKTCEVKTERDQWARTGNVFIEFECNGVPSGIMATTADIWHINLVLKDNLKMYMGFNRKQLMDMIARMKPRIVSGGDGYRARGFLIPIDKLIKEIRA